MRFGRFLLFVSKLRTYPVHFPNFGGLQACDLVLFQHHDPFFDVII